VRHCVLCCFNLGQTAAEDSRLVCEAYGGEGVFSSSEFPRRYGRFQSGEIGACGRPSSGRPGDLM
ncbi:hypothetical protein M513_12000, partial [Trichuris suis]